MSGFRFFAERLFGASLYIRQSLGICGGFQQQKLPRSTCLKIDSTGFIVFLMRIAWLWETVFEQDNKRSPCFPNGTRYLSFPRTDSGRNRNATILGLIECIRLLRGYLLLTQRAGTDDGLLFGIIQEKEIAQRCKA